MTGLAYLFNVISLPVISDPRLVDFVRSRKTQKTSSVPSTLQGEACSDRPVTESRAPEPHGTDPKLDSQEVTMDADEEDEAEPVIQPPITGEQWLSPLRTSEQPC